MRKFVFAAVTAVSLGAGTLMAAAPASAAPIDRFCWHHPYAPVCYFDRHHHHRHYYPWWW